MKHDLPAPTKLIWPRMRIPRVDTRRSETVIQDLQGQLQELRKRERRIKKDLSLAHALLHLDLGISGNHCSCCGVQLTSGMRMAVDWNEVTPRGGLKILCEVCVTKGEVKRLKADDPATPSWRTDGPPRT